MSDKDLLLTTKRMSIVPTMRCTLHCKLCSNHMPAFKNPVDATVEEMERDIDNLFVLFDRIEWLQFVGGEIFLHTGMAQVYDYCHRYEDKFSKLILETNATLPPRPKEIDALHSFGDRANVMISDYGAVSRGKKEFIRAFEENGIPYILKKYYGEDQHFGGWIDNTGRRDYGESDETVAKLYPNCPQMRIENMHCYRGKLHLCPNSLFLSELKLFEPNEKDFVDLNDGAKSLEEKQKIIRQFYKYPPKSCHYCMWKYAATMPRYSAAEQLTTL